jgi:radical SAM-linked protein
MMPSNLLSIRYRLKFKKTAGMRFTGTLDVQRALERTLRRARLNVAYTQGFNPHPRLSLGAALPLGLTSDCELADIWLEGDEEPSGLLAQLREEQPPGLEILELNRVPEGEPSLETQIVAAEYLAEFDTTVPNREIQDRLRALMEMDSLPRERRGKAYDLKPLIEQLDIAAAGAGLRMRLASREGATGRPDEVLLALGLDPAAARIRRTRLFLSLPEATTNAPSP